MQQLNNSQRDKNALPNHIIVTVDKPVVTTSEASLVCLPGHGICADAQLVPLFSVLGVIIAATIAGIAAIWAASRQAKGALTAAQAQAAGALAAAKEQAAAALQVSINQTNASLESQRLNAANIAAFDRERLERSSTARRRRLKHLLRFLANDFGYYGSYRDGIQTPMFSWRVDQLESYASDDRLIEMLTEEEADALHAAVDSCKANSGNVDRALKALKKQPDSEYALHQIQRHCRYGLLSIKALQTAIGDEEGIGRTTFSLSIVPEPPDSKDALKYAEETRARLASLLEERLPESQSTAHDTASSKGSMGAGSDHE